mmetsp:Transcript_90655/g.283482  ORF Transcript_90655/g.283482 Transcript_90655/m.283482 type:complete len:108 (+) Transcript_90655:1262-1585(+)
MSSRTRCRGLVVRALVHQHGVCRKGQALRRAALDPRGPEAAPPGLAVDVLREGGAEQSPRGASTLATCAISRRGECAVYICGMGGQGHAAMPSMTRLLMSMRYSFAC